MSSTLLDRPPPRVSTPPPPRPRRVPAPLRKTARRRGIFPIALVVSTLVHLVVLVTLRFESAVAPSPPGGRTEDIAERPIDMQIVDMVVVDGQAAIAREPERPAARTPNAPPVAPAPTRTAPVPVPAAETPARRGDPESLAERLRPRMADPRLWNAPGAPAEAPPVHPDEAVRARVASRLGTWNDSMRLAEEAAARAVDWTVKDKDGGRWGVSPKGIHLGSFTLPLPIQFATPPGRRDAVNNAARNWNEIQAQRSQAEIQESVEARIRAIRERKEAERRDSTRRAGGGT